MNKKSINWDNYEAEFKKQFAEKEVHFYADRLSTFIEFVEKYTIKDINCYFGRVIEGAKQWDPVTTPRLIKQELERLENISEEEFRKENKWSNAVEWKEMTIEEIADMLEYSPNGKSGEKVNDTTQRKINDCHINLPPRSHNSIIAAAIITILSLAAGLLIIKRYWKKNGSKR